MSAVKPVPDGYHSIQPYLYIAGAAEAIALYKKAFGAIETMCMPMPDGRVGHAELRFADSVIMMADEFPERGIHSPKHYGGSPFSLIYYGEDCDAVYHQAIATGAKSVREPADQFYGDRSAGVEDPFGFQWHFATHIKDLSPEEMKATMAEQKPE